jgi:hypothetical protein
MELGAVGGLSLLERMAGMCPAYTFKVRYYGCPEDILFGRYFYTQDKVTLEMVEAELKRNSALIAQIRDRAEKKALKKRSRDRKVFPRFVRFAKCCKDILAPHEHDTFGYIFIGGDDPPEFRDGVEYTLTLRYSFDRVDFIVETESE